MGATGFKAPHNSKQKTANGHQVTPKSTPFFPNPNSILIAIDALDAQARQLLLAALAHKYGVPMVGVPVNDEEVEAR